MEDARTVLAEFLRDEAPAFIPCDRHWLQAVPPLATKLSFFAQKTALPSPQFGNEGGQINCERPCSCNASPSWNLLTYDRPIYYRDFFSKECTEFDQGREGRSSGTDESSS